VRSVSDLKGKTLFITGASRGIGKAIGLRAAADGANIVIVAKTGEPHPKLPGTVYTAAKEMEEAGGQALPLVVDIRSEDKIADAVAQANDKFGGIDILVNNASAIMLTGTLNTPMKRYDLMHSVNTRGTFASTQACLPSLLKADNPHVLNISPPLSMKPKWFSSHVAYTMAKFGMSMCVLGHAAEFKGKVGFNALWPKTAIATAAVAMLGGDAMTKHSRKVEIMANAAHAILTRPHADCSGNFFVDEDVLREGGETDFTQYSVDPSVEPMLDFFLD